MRKAISAVAVLVCVGIAVLFVDTNSVSAKRALTSRGDGCYVRVNTGENDYVVDLACTAHDVLKMNDDGSFEFYVYQDHGQLPEGTWRPSQPFRNTFEQCLNFSFGTVCGTVKESVSPSGEYKSSFKSH